MSGKKSYKFTENIYQTWQQLINKLRNNGKIASVTQNSNFLTQLLMGCGAK